MITESIRRNLRFNIDMILKPDRDWYYVVIEQSRESDDYKSKDYKLTCPYIANHKLLAILFSESDR